MNPQRFWGIHAGAKSAAFNLFLSKGVIALGWPLIGDISTLEDRHEIIEQFTQAYQGDYQYSGRRTIATASGTLYRFLKDVSVGDIVVVYAGKGSMFYLGEITNKYKFNPMLSEEYPHQRKTKWKARVPRKMMSKGFLYTMGSGMPLFSMDKHTQEILQVLGKEAYNIPGCSLLDFV